jgi:hypothetical protein
MTNSITVTAKGIVYLMGLSVISVCAILLPELAREDTAGKVNPPSSLPFLLGAWLLCLPILIALFYAHKFINLIENSEAFTHKAVRALEVMKYSTIVFSFLLVAIAVTVVALAKMADPTEDVTPVITIGSILTFVSLVIATFIAVLQELLHEAINIRSENDLTV